MSAEKITMRAAARALHVTERSIKRYLEKGLLTKVQEGYRVYLLADEVRRFRRDSDKGGSANIQTSDMQDIVTMPGDKFREMAAELGSLREKCNYLIEHVSQQKKIEKELDETRGMLKENDGFLKTIFEENEDLRKNLQSFQKELDRLKSRGLIKRLFNK